MAHHIDPVTNRIYVDTGFLNSLRGVPGVSLEHMGFGEFYFETPQGRVEVDRMRGKEFEGQSGRSHWLHDDAGGQKAAEWLLDQAERKSQSQRVARRHIADSLAAIMSDLEKLSDLDLSLDVMENSFSRHFPGVITAAEIPDAELDSQTESLKKARAGLKAAQEMKARVTEILGAYPEEKLAKRALTDADKMVVNFTKHEAAAAKIIKTLAKKQLPKALKAYAKKVEQILLSRFVDPSRLEIIPWVGRNPWCKTKNQWGETKMVPGLQYQMVFRVKVPEFLDYNKGVVEMIVAEDSIGDEGTRITTTSGLTPAEIKGGPVVFAEKFLDRLRGWSGIQGEASASTARLTLATQIGSVLRSVAGRLGSAESPEIDPAGRSVSVHFRTGLRGEGRDEHDDRWVQEGEELYGKPGRKALEPFKGHIRKFLLDYGEKGWWNFYVELK